MKTVKVLYTVQYEAVLNIDDDVDIHGDDFDDEISDISIPENKTSKYVADSFDVIALIV